MGDLPTKNGEIYQFPKESDEEERREICGVCRRRGREKRTLEAMKMRSATCMMLTKASQNTVET